MTPQHIILAIAAASTASALAMFYWCEFGKGGIHELRNELDAEIELNVKLFKEKADWILERAKYRRTLNSPIKLAEMLKLANEIDAVISSATRKQSVVDEVGQGERTSVESSSARPASPTDKEVSATVEAERGASVESGPTVDSARTVLPDDWRNKTCDEVGHRFENGEGHCLRCTARQASVDDIAEIRSTEKTAS